MTDRRKASDPVQEGSVPALAGHDTELIGPAAVGTPIGDELAGSPMGVQAQHAREYVTRVVDELAGAMRTGWPVLEPTESDKRATQRAGRHSPSPKPRR